MSRVRLVLVVALVLAPLLSFVVPVRTALADAVINVTTTADEFNTSGSGAGCSLREAIHAANTDLPFGGCSAASGTFGNDLIVLQAGQLYELTTRDNAQYGYNGAPVIYTTMTIEGNGATIRRSTAGGTPTFRLFHVARAGDFLPLLSPRTAARPRPAGT